MSPLFLGFLGVSFLVLATPGPDTALTVRNALLGGRRGGVFTAAGIVAGQAIWVLATSVGLVALVAACEPVFEAIKWLGSAYLVWLGATGLWAAWRGKMPALAAGAGAAPTSRLSSASAFRQGLLSDLGNPKMAVFFSSLLPQFASEATFTSLALLGLVFCAMTFTWLAGYAMLLSLVGDYVRRRSVWRTIEAITGAALVALGLKLAAEQR
ncbi:MAG: LysE family translocator [Alphaproteobacteria bacterium]|nr:LysE family translocator [Alphaproteobacteria bacterium]